MISPNLITLIKITRSLNLSRLRNESKVMQGFDSYNEMIQCFQFSDFHLVKQHINGCKFLLTVIAYPQVAAIIILYSALIHIALARIENRRTAPHAKKMCRALPTWSVLSLVQLFRTIFPCVSELLALRKLHDLAFSKYVAAISISKEAGSLVQIALANELAAKHLYTVGMRTKSLPFFNEAIQYHTTWGVLI